ncbi:MAG: oligosaccharide repeat unit polymerase [Bifidobacterium sp.]|nr:oligosaccharide repeat unit polymerase [Bifidobacterium sp.]
MAPSVVTTASFFFSSICCTIGYGHWHNITLSTFTIILIVGSVYLFCAFSIPITHIYKNKHIKAKTENNSILYTAPPTKNWKVILLLIFIIVVSTLYLNQIITLINAQGHQNYTVIEKLKAYRGSYILNAKNDGAGINVVIGQLRNLIDAIVPMLFFEFFREKKLLGKFNYWLLITLVTGLFSSFVSSGRTLFFTYILSGLVLYVYFFRFQNKKVTSKTVTIFCAFILGMLFLVFALNALLKRDVALSFIDYISFYFGSSITNLNAFLAKPYLGEGETLNGISKIIHTLGFTDAYIPPKNDWIEYGNSDIYSNIYTALKAYYTDAGVVSVIFYVFIFSLAVSFLYKKAEGLRHPLLAVFYSIIFDTLVDQARREAFFAYFLRISLPITLVALWLLYKFLLSQPILKISHEKTTRGCTNKKPLEQ